VNKKVTSVAIQQLLIKSDGNSIIEDKSASLKKKPFIILLSHCGVTQLTAKITPQSTDRFS